MPSAMALMKKMEINTPVKGLSGIVLDTAVGMGTSYAIGRLYVQHNDKFYGKQSARIAAAGGKLGAIVLSMVSGGHPTILGGVLNSVGQAGLNAIAVERGLTDARKKIGKKAVMIPAGTDTKSIPGASDLTAIGALGRVQGGKGLSWDAIQELAAGH